MKIPEPMIPPMTIIVASKSPSFVGEDRIGKLYHRRRRGRTAAGGIR